MESLLELQQRLASSIKAGTATLEDRITYAEILPQVLKVIKAQLLSGLGDFMPTQDELKSLNGVEIPLEFTMPDADGVVTEYTSKIKISEGYVADNEWYAKANIPNVDSNASYARYLDANDLPHPEWLEAKTTVYIKDYELAYNLGGPGKPAYTLDFKTPKVVKAKKAKKQ